MHRVGSASNGNNSSRPRKEKRLTYVLNDSDDTKVNLLFILLVPRKQTSFMLASSSCNFMPTNFFFDILLLNLLTG